MHYKGIIHSSHEPARLFSMCGKPAPHRKQTKPLTTCGPTPGAFGEIERATQMLAPKRKLKVRSPACFCVCVRVSLFPPLYCRITSVNKGFGSCFPTLLGKRRRERDLKEVETTTSRTSHRVAHRKWSQKE